MSRIFGVSSSTRLGIKGYLTCWKDELGNHTLGTKAQMVPMLWHSAQTPNPGTMPWSTQTHEGFLCFGNRQRHQTRAPWLGPPRLMKGKSNFFTNHNFIQALK